MEFLEENQICQWAEQHRLAIGEHSTVRLPELPSQYRGTYADGRRSGREGVAAKDLIAHLGAWDECVVWITLWGVWRSGENWPRFYAWRGNLGERRSLDVAAGHWFDRADIFLLTELLTLVMENAWDADVLCSRHGRADALRGKISHDEWYEILAAPINEAAG